MIPVSAIICTKNEAARIAPCLRALHGFDEVVVIDSASTDGTARIAEANGARVEPFIWNGRYPKKRQWALDHLPLKHERILFVDADELMTDGLRDEIAALDWAQDGYFIKGAPVWRGRVLRHGLFNNKLVLFDKNKFLFPAIDDLDIGGMGEMEGHYQPVPHDHATIGQLRHALTHECEAGWDARHARYAAWEAAMIARSAFPRDPVLWRERMKRLFRRLPCRGLLVFLYGYLWRRGFLDGRAGYGYARAKAAYYSAVNRHAARRYTGRK